MGTFRGGIMGETPMLRRGSAKRGRSWCAEVDPHGWKVRVTGEDIGTMRAVIYSYWARCAPGWCWRAARFGQVGKWSGKWRKIILKIRILCFGALRARALLARSARVMSDF